MVTCSEEAEEGVETSQDSKDILKSRLLDREASGVTIVLTTRKCCFAQSRIMGIQGMVLEGVDGIFEVFKMISEIYFLKAGHLKWLFIRHVKG